MNLLINNIYYAAEGEGVRLGTPQIFIRFQGCTIGCVNCDSKQTWQFDSRFERSAEDVITEVRRLTQTSGNSIGWVSITGGDPLHAKHLPGVRLLLDHLSDDFKINLEASGTHIVEDIFDRLDFISFDYKTPSTGVKTKTNLLVQLAQKYPGKCQIKSVIETPEDLQAAHDALLEAEKVLKNKVPFPWCLTPSYNPGESFPQQRFAMVLEENQKIGSPFRVIGQQHKWIFGPDKEDV